MLVIHLCMAFSGHLRRKLVVKSFLDANGCARDRGGVALRSQSPCLEWLIRTFGMFFSTMSTGCLQDCRPLPELN